MGDQPAMARSRDSLSAEAESALEVALRTAVDPRVRADAYVAHGNLDWLLANFPPLPAAATQPSLALPKSSADYLAAAASAYSEVLKDPLSKNQAAVTAARFGLSAIAENKEDWALAQRYYNDVINDPGTAPAMKEYGQGRLKVLEDLKRPVLLASEHPIDVPPPVAVPTLGPFGPTTAPDSINGLSPFSISPAPYVPATTQPGGR